MRKRVKIYPSEWIALIVITVVVFSAPLLFGAIKGGISYLFSGGTNVAKVAEVDISDYVAIEAEAGIKEGADVNKQVDIAKDVFKLDDNILIHASGRLLAFDKAGKNIWNRDIRSDNADIVKWNDKTVIVDKFRGDIAVVNSENQVLKSISEIGQIEKIRASDEKLYVKLLGENIIDIYSLELEKVARIDDDYGSLINFIVDPESSELIVYTISVKEEQLKSFLYVYNKEAELIGSSDIESSIVFDMFIEDNINIICDDKILTFTKNAESISEFVYAGSVDDVIAKNSSLYGIFSKGSTAEYRRSLTVLDEKLEEVKSVDLPNSAKGIEAGERVLLVYSDNKISVFDYSLNNENTINTSINVEKLKWMSDDYFYVTDNKKVSIYKVY